MMKDEFWTEVMPTLMGQFNWGGQLADCLSKKSWEKSLHVVVKNMDTEEFNLFLAQVVMAAAKKQIMGEDLTRRIKFLKSLR